jgi:hypothetical protein
MSDTQDPEKTATLEPAEEVSNDSAAPPSPAASSDATPSATPSEADSSDASPSSARPPAPKPGGGASFWAFLRDTYGTADPRSLALFRIALATLLFVDVARRWPDVEAHYANTGWLTNHYALFRPMSSHLFSVYLAFTTPTEVKTMMAIHLAICVLFAIGYRTRLMHVLLALLTVSINSRNIMLENGGWVVLTELVVWSMFLPTGRRFSVDALLASLKARRESTAAALSEPLRRDTSPVVSFAVAALIFQWVVIYYFNVVHKSGPEWRNGSAVYYFFQQDRMVTDLGAWVRQHLPVWIFYGMTYSTLVIESAIALLLASPFRTASARMIAWGLCAALHLSIDAVVQLGPFSWAMVTMFWVLIPREAWEKLGPRLAARRPLRELCFNPDSGFWLRFCGFVKRFDVLERVRFVPVTPPVEKPTAEPTPDAVAVAGALATTEAAPAVEAAPVVTATAPAKGSDEHEEADGDDDEEEGEEDVAESRAPATAEELAQAVERNLTVVDPKTNQRWTGVTALRRIGDAIPFGSLLVLPTRLPGVSKALDRRLQQASRKPRRADRYFELEKLPGAPEPFERLPSAAALGFARVRKLGSEALVLVLVVCCGSQVLIENRAVPKWLKPEKRPEWMTAVVVYPRMFQGWSMFAPSPPSDDGRVVVDGVTKDGRKLDPLTGQAPSFEVQPKGGFRMNQIWGDWHRRIGEQRFEGYLDGVREMIKNYHLVTGEKQNELRSFEVWFVNERIPPPGHKRGEPERRRLFSFGAAETTTPRPKRPPTSRPDPHRPPRRSP